MGAGAPGAASGEVGVKEEVDTHEEDGVEAADPGPEGVFLGCWAVTCRVARTGRMRVAGSYRAPWPPAPPWDGSEGGTQGTHTCFGPRGPVPSQGPPREVLDLQGMGGVRGFGTGMGPDRTESGGEEGSRVRKGPDGVTGQEPEAERVRGQKGPRATPQWSGVGAGSPGRPRGAASAGSRPPPRPR